MPGARRGLPRQRISRAGARPTRRDPRVGEAQRDRSAALEVQRADRYLTSHGSVTAVAPPLFHRILIANRGEVAVRVARACDALGITPVFAVSEADRAAPYTRGREVVVLGPARAAHSYLDVVRVVQAAVQSRCSALHPGWGFLSENPLLATLCAQHGVTFIGPPPQVTALMGSKTRAKAAMRAAGLQVIAGSASVLASLDDARRIARETGFP